MTKTAFFIRFTIVYTVAMAITGVSMSLIGFEEVSHLNTPILMSISFWFFYSYSNKNERVIVGGETWALIFLALLGDIITTVLLGTPSLLANGIEIKYLFVGMLFVLPLHLLIFIGVSFFVRKMMMKQRTELEEK